MPYRLPKKLMPGDRVGVAAPSSPMAEWLLAPALAYLADCGLEVVLGRSVYERHRFVAGEDEARAADFNAFAASPDIKAIFAARGGYGSARILEKVDYSLFAEQPKAVFGFSDTTALQLALLAHAELISYSGFLPVPDLSKGPLHPVTEKGLRRAFWQPEQPIACVGLSALRGGCASGALIGGCLSLFCSLLGTRYLPDCKGAVLLFEDVGEQPYRLDRMLTQLRQAVDLSTVAAVVFGRFHNCESKDPDDGGTREVLDEFAASLACPVALGLDYGHGEGGEVLPLGAPCRLDADAGTLCIG